MKDQELFDGAVHWSLQRAYLLALASSPDRERRTHWTRRQCLAAARKAERRVFDLSIAAEQRCLGELDAAEGAKPDARRLEPQASISHYASSEAIAGVRTATAGAH